MAGNDNASYLVGKLLLAMPSMTDPRFEKAVIFMCAHDDQGAMGLMINHSIPDVTFKNLLEQVGITSDIRVNISRPVMSGGPVESSRGFLLHTSEFTQEDTIKINDALSVTGTIDALKEVAKGNGPEEMLFILGYAGWGAGQLEQEIQANSWLITDPDPSIIFSGNDDNKWINAVGKMGVDPAMLSGTAGRA
mgnify:CR=1 FL=1